MTTPPDATEETRLVSKPDAQRLLGGLSRSTIERMIKASQLPTVKIGRRVFVPADAVEAFIRDAQVGG